VVPVSQRFLPSPFGLRLSESNIVLPSLLAEEQNACRNFFFFFFLIF